MACSVEICQLRSTAAVLQDQPQMGRYSVTTSFCAHVQRGGVAQNRLTARLSSEQSTVLPQSVSPRVRGLTASGRLSASTVIGGVSLYFSMTASQEASLTALIEAQQQPGSSSYRAWLSPEEFATRFGLSDADVAQVRTWLEQQGLTVESVSRSKRSVRFSGTVVQIESALQTTLETYSINGTTQYANSTDISLPASLGAATLGIRNLTSFRPKPHFVRKESVSGHFTSSQTGSHFLTPKDVATIYDINTAYNSGYTGAGQSITVVGQSTIRNSDIENFQKAAGLTVTDPVSVLVPNSGSSVESTGDEAESDLDVEYSRGIAKDATVYFVYVGNNSNYSVFDSLQYAVDNRLTPVISVSYGTCETELSSSDYASLNSILQQAAAQGQTVVAASGDSGSTDCYQDTDLSSSQRTALAVDFPASSQYVTGLGGTEFASGDVSSSNTAYWTSASGSDVIASAKSYIPEQVWNDDSSSSGLSSGGGGTSTLTSRPSWQTGVTGIPSGSYRLVPDISLSSSPNNAGYLYCSSDSDTGISGSCSNGFRDSNGTYLTVAGGTSFAAPIFAGMMAILNQKTQSTGLGTVNSELYLLAGSTSNYSSAFHDVTSGSNACTAGSQYCTSSAASAYSASTGYDEASGLGSVDFSNLMMLWPSSSVSSGLQATSTTLSAASSQVSSGASDSITITVASLQSSASGVPTGTLTISVDGITSTSSLQLVNGSATYSFSSTASGSHSIVATYSGSTAFSSSTGSAVITVGTSSGTSGTGSFSVTAGNITVAAGSSATSTVTVTPKGGYTGTVNWTLASSASLSNACYSISSLRVTSSSPATTNLTIYTSTSACNGGSSQGAQGRRQLALITAPGVGGSVSFAATVGFLTMFGLPLLRRRKRRSVPLLLSITFALTCLLAGLAGCGSTSQTSTASNAAKGTYALTLTGTDGSSSSITASTNLTLTIN
jgi:hypothetical protein